LSFQVRLSLLLIWVFIMLSFIWTHDLHGALYSEHFHFDFNPQPHFKDLLIYQDINIWSSFWWVAKLSHFFSFAIFDGLLFLLVKNKNVTLCSSVAFAIFTEVIQLYFYRDGRIYDIMIDSFGAYLMYSIISKHNSSSHHNGEN
jgi:hypothetical protein